MPWPSTRSTLCGLMNEGGEEGRKKGIKEGEGKKEEIARQMDRGGREAGRKEGRKESKQASKHASKQARSVPNIAQGTYSATGTRTRVARVSAGYPNQLDYSGS